MKIRKLKKRDIKQCSKIVGKNYSLYFEKRSEKEMEEMFNDAINKPAYFVAEKKGEILGFVGYDQSSMDYGVYQIFWGNVDPKFQKKGIGTVLVKRIISEIKKIKGKHKKAKLVQLTTTQPRFYRDRFGFEIIAKIDKDEYLMSINL